MNDDETKEIADELGIEPGELDNMDEEKIRLMRDHEIDEDKAEQAQELIEEGLDEDEAIEVVNEL